VGVLCSGAGWQTLLRPRPRKEAIMASFVSGPGCACCGISRRSFIAAGCAACAGGIAFAASPAVSRFSGAAKSRIRILYSLHAAKQDRPDWPNVGFDFAPPMQRITGALRQALPGFEFVESLATGPEDAQKILAADGPSGVDGYVVCQMNAWNRVVQTIATSAKPVLYVDFQFGGSGGFLVYSAEFLRKATPNVGFVSSSKIEDLASAARCFEQAVKSGAASGFAAAVARTRIGTTPKPGNLSCTPDDSLTTLSATECLARMRKSKILSVRDEKSGPGQPMMEIPVENVSFAEVNEAWKTADKELSREVAERWKKNASQVLDVSAETLLTSAAMYVGMKKVLKNHDANAITINCLGGFYGGHIHAYPCLGFHELNNEGLVGACECDVRSTATMVAFTAMTQGRPGYISDPVIDTSKRQIIYAHCVASNKAFGPKGPANPFVIMTHSEDRQGASVRSIMPLGYLTTTLEILPDKKEILLHQAKAVANDPDDRACRTKLCGEPLGDIEKLFTQWDRYGWHRVTFYGDLKDSAYALADKIGWTVVRET
jgi:hypothetical protein